MPAGGTANLKNFVIFPSDYFKQTAALASSSRKTAASTRRPTSGTSGSEFTIEVFGKTVAGKKVSLPFDVNLNFFYVTP